MPTYAIPLAEFDQEMSTTRRLLERVPDGKGDWKPHPKSFSLAHLAQLVARMPGWIVGTLRQPNIDLASSARYSTEKTSTLLAEFDRNVKSAREALADVTDAKLMEPWSLVMGEKVMFTAPRGPITRQTLSHLVHHRGQLTVYLRELDVPIPSIYGPTADEGWQA
jgi:uncharacterized damage-inducible protein DinB